MEALCTCEALLTIAPIFNPITLLVESSVNAIAFFIQTTVDLVTFLVQAAINLVAFLVQTIVDAVTAIIQSIFNAIAAIVESVIDALGNCVIGQCVAAHQEQSAKKRCRPDCLQFASSHSGFLSSLCGCYWFNVPLAHRLTRHQTHWRIMFKL